MGNWFTLENRGKIIGLWAINSSIGNVIGAQFTTGLIQEGLE